MTTDPWQQKAGHCRTGSRNRQQAAERQAQDTGPSHLFDDHQEVGEGRRRRDAGMATTERAAHPAAWVALAAVKERRLVGSGDPFTSDTVRSHAEPLGSSPTVVGALIAAAARAGTIRRTGFVQTSRPQAHGRHIAMWVVGTGGASCG
jgi:hypothetical protein